jgi:hypothetical protein
MLHQGDMYSSEPQSPSGRRAACPNDLFMYQFILGKPVHIKQPDGEEPAPDATPASFQELTRKAWAASVGQITHQLRKLWRQRHAPAELQPQVVGWLRHISGQAFRRLDEAQVRLSNSRTGAGVRRVQSREVMSIRPADPRERDYQGREYDGPDYKRVA